MLHHERDPATEASAPVVALHLRGYPELRVGGHPVPLKLKRGFALVAWLAETGRKASRAELADLLWPGVPLATGRTRLRRLCHEVGSQAGLPLLDGDADAVWLAQPVATDVARVRAAAMQILKAPEQPQSRVSLELLCAPGAGSVLEGFAIESDSFESWLGVHRAQQERLVARALERVAHHLLHAGQPSLAADAAAALVRLDPFAESGHALLLHARAHLGDGAAVEAAYFACADLLREELGIRPSAQIEAAYAQARARLDAPHQEALPDPSRMPAIRFAETSDGVVAFLEVGSGQAKGGTLVVLFGLWSHLEVAWEEPRIRGILQRLAARFRVVLMDRRGIGLSDRTTPQQVASSGAQDVEAIRRHLGEDRIWLFGNSVGGSVAIEYAASFPSRVKGLILYAAGARGTRAKHYPWALSDEQLRAWQEKIKAGWGGATSLEQFAPSEAQNEAARAWWARMMRQSASRSGLATLLAALAKVDVCDRLPFVQSPTLVIQREGDRIVREGASRYVSGHIAGARLLVLPGNDHLLWFGDSDAVIDALEGFVESLSGTQPPAPSPAT